MNKKDKLLSDGVDTLSGLRVAGTIKGLSELLREKEEFLYLPLDQIKVDSQIRSAINMEGKSFTALTTSIQKKGVLEPVIVQDRDDSYLLVAGERRFRACQALGFQNIPARVLPSDTTSDDILIVRLIENIHRENLNPVDEAMAYVQFFDMRLGIKHIDGIMSYLIDYSIHPEKLSHHITDTVSVIETLSGKSIRTIQRMLSLLKLPEDVLSALREGKINLTHGYILASNIEHEKFRTAFEKLLQSDESFTKDTLGAYLKSAERKKGTVKNLTFQFLMSQCSAFRKNVDEIKLDTMSEKERQRLLKEACKIKNAIEHLVEKFGQG